MVACCSQYKKENEVKTVNATAEEITKQIIFGSVAVMFAALLFVGMLFGVIALRKRKGIYRTGSHDSVLVLHMKKD